MTRGSNKKGSMLFGNKRKKQDDNKKKGTCFKPSSPPILVFKPPIPSTPLNTNPKLHADTHKTSNLSPKRLKNAGPKTWLEANIYIYI